MNHFVLNNLINSATRPDRRETEKNFHTIGPDYSLSRVFYRIVDTVEGLTVRRAR